MLSTEAKFVTISAIFFSLACVAEVILPRLYNNVSVKILVLDHQRAQ